MLTVGHGTLEQALLTDLLRDAGVVRVVDVRRYPGSRRHPLLSREALTAALPEAGLAYRWEERLGGRRTPAPDAPDIALRNTAFRGYAAHMRDPEFLAAVDALLVDADDARTAVMCAESLWWRCHRRLIADFVVLARGGRVEHLMHDGRLVVHPPTDDARVGPDGLLVYDAGADSLPWER